MAFMSSASQSRVMRYERYWGGVINFPVPQTAPPPACTLASSDKQPFLLSNGKARTIENNRTVKVLPRSRYCPHLCQQANKMHLFG